MPPTATRMLQSATSTAADQSLLADVMFVLGLRASRGMLPQARRSVTGSKPGRRQYRATGRESPCPRLDAIAGTLHYRGALPLGVIGNTPDSGSGIQGSSP